MKMYERAKKVFPPAAGRSTTLGITKAEGCYVYDESEKKYLDFASGVAVNNLGNCYPSVVEAIQKELQQMIHVGHNVVYYPSYIKLAEKLVELTGGDTMVYFSNSGAEANEGAIKLAKYVTRRPAVIAFKNSFHGRTMATVSITGSNSAYRKYYEPLMPSVYWAEYANCYRCPFGKEKGCCDMACLKQFDGIFEKLVDPECVAAIIVEPIQGEGGYIVPPDAFLKGLRKICNQHGILLIFDEVQTGVGRTGSLYASETFDVKPDIFSTAKALGGGIPLSAVIAKKEIMEQWPSGAHGGTFGGNPLACAAAYETLRVLTEDGVLEHVREIGTYFMEQLVMLQEKYPSSIGDVRGKGLMLAIEIVHPDGSPNGLLCDELIKYALDQQLILLKCGSDHNVIRFIAPLIVEKEQIDQAISVLDMGLKQYC